MSERKQVLIVDDEDSIRETLTVEFNNCVVDPGFPYVFQVDEARTATEGVGKVRATQYDVIVLDIVMETLKSGLDLACSITEQLGYQLPVTIMYSGKATEIPSCVEAMRGGAWDYVLKRNRPGMLAARIVVNSAVTRLRQMDVRRTQEQIIAEKWLAAEYHALEQDYSGQFIAVWHEPQVEIVAVGRDAFELAENLKASNWRAEHKDGWQQPYVLQIRAAP